MLSAVGVYVAVGFAVGDRAGGIDLDRELRTWLKVFLSIAAGLHVLTALLLRQAIAGLSSGRYVNYCIIRWALMEGIAVYGLILKILGADWTISGIFFAVAAVLLFSAQPGEDDRRVFVTQFR
jgi:hypothetical protein